MGVLPQTSSKVLFSDQIDSLQREVTNNVHDFRKARCDERSVTPGGKDLSLIHI